MSALNHTHTYVRSRTSRAGVIYYRCSDPHCYHEMPLRALIGKANRCPFCGNEHMLTTRDLERVKPRCLLCSKTKKGDSARKAKAVIDSLFNPDKQPTLLEIGSGTVIQEPNGTQKETKDANDGSSSQESNRENGLDFGENSKPTPDTIF